MAKIKLPTTFEEFTSPEGKAAIKAAEDIINALAVLQVVLETPTANNTFQRGLIALQGDPPNLMLRLPFRFNAPIADSTATAASVSAQLNLVLAQLRLNGMLPS